MATEIKDYALAAAMEAGDLILIQRGNTYRRVTKEQLLTGFQTDELPEGEVNKYLTSEALISLLQSSVTIDDIDVNDLAPIARSTLVVLDTAAIDNLNTSPFELLPVPPAGKQYTITRGWAEYVRTAGTWTGNANLEVYIGAELIGEFPYQTYTGAANRIGNLLLEPWYTRDLGAAVTLQLQTNTNGGDGLLYVLLQYYVTNIE